MEAKRMRFSANNSAASHSEKLELKIWQNLQLSKCYDDNYINRLLESTRSFLVASEELTVENEAISTAIQHFGLKKQSFDMFDNTSDDSNLPSTSSQRQSPSSSASRQHSTTSSTTSSTDTLTIESEAINSAISSFGLHKNGI